MHRKKGSPEAGYDKLAWWRARPSPGAPPPPPAFCDHPYALPQARREHTIGELLEDVPLGGLARVAVGVVDACDAAQVPARRDAELALMYTTALWGALQETPARVPPLRVWWWGLFEEGRDAATSSLYANTSSGPVGTPCPVDRLQVDIAMRLLQLYVLYLREQQYGFAAACVLRMGWPTLHGLVSTHGLPRDLAPAVRDALYLFARLHAEWPCIAPAQRYCLVRNLWTTVKYRMPHQARIAGGVWETFRRECHQLFCLARAEWAPVIVELACDGATHMRLAYAACLYMRDTLGIEMAGNAHFATCADALRYDPEPLPPTWKRARAWAGEWWIPGLERKQPLLGVPRRLSCLPTALLAVRWVDQPHTPAGVPDSPDRLPKTRPGALVQRAADATFSHEPEQTPEDPEE